MDIDDVHPAPNAANSENQIHPTTVAGTGTSPPSPSPLRLSPIRASTNLPPRPPRVLMSDGRSSNTTRAEHGFSQGMQRTHAPPKIPANTVLLGPKPRFTLHRIIQQTSSRIPRIETRLAAQLNYIDDSRVSRLQQHTQAVKRFFNELLQLQLSLPDSARFHLFFESEHTPVTKGTKKITSVDLFSLFSSTVSTESRSRRYNICDIGEVLVDFRNLCEADRRDFVEPTNVTVAESRNDDNDTIPNSYPSSTCGFHNPVSCNPSVLPLTSGDSRTHSATQPPHSHGVSARTVSHPPAGEHRNGAELSSARHTNPSNFKGQPSLQHDTPSTANRMDVPVDAGDVDGGDIYEDW